jgi:hypothetical protein
MVWAVASAFYSVGIFVACALAVDRSYRRGDFWSPTFLASWVGVAVILRETKESER